MKYMYEQWYSFVRKFKKNFHIGVRLDSTKVATFRIFQNISEADCLRVIVYNMLIKDQSKGHKNNDSRGSPPNFVSNIKRINQF